MPDNSKEEPHYVAVINIFKITKKNIGLSDGRVKSDELKTTVKAENLSQLKRKVLGHINLMEEVDLDG